MDIQERTSISGSGVNGQHVQLYGFNTIWENPQYDVNKEFRKLDPYKNWGGYHIARGHPKCGKLIIKMGATKMEFNFNHADMWFNP